MVSFLSASEELVFDELEVDEQAAKATVARAVIPASDRIVLNFIVILLLYKQVRPTRSAQNNQIASDYRHFDQSEVPDATGHPENVSHPLIGQPQ